MIISAKSPIGKYVRVLVDGEDYTSYGVYADTDDGYVDYRIRDVNGKLLLNDDWSDVIQFRRYGKVEVHLARNVPSYVFGNK